MSSFRNKNCSNNFASEKLYFLFYFKHNYKGNSSYQVAFPIHNGGLIRMRVISIIVSFKIDYYKLCFLDATFDIVRNKHFSNEKIIIAEIKV